MYTLIEELIFLVFHKGDFVNDDCEDVKFINILIAFLKIENTLIK